MNLRDYIETNGLTVKKMAEMLDCHPNHLSKVLNKIVKPSRRLARFVETMTKGQVTAKSLLETEDKENKEGNKE